MPSNAVPPSVTPPSPNEWPQNLVLYLTGITKDSIAKVTCPNHGMTSSSNGVTFLTFKQVEGMLQINGITATVLQVIDANNFTVNVDTTNFFTYQSGGVVIIDSGLPPMSQQGFQYFNTPFQNVASQI